MTSDDPDPQDVPEFDRALGVDDDVVTPIPDERVLVHEPSDEAFDSIIQLAVFH